MDNPLIIKHFQAFEKCFGYAVHQSLAEAAISVLLLKFIQVRSEQGTKGKILRSGSALKVLCSKAVSQSETNSQPLF